MNKKTVKCEIVHTNFLNGFPKFGLIMNKKHYAMENISTQESALRELREIRKLLQDHFHKDNPKEVDLPNLVDMTFVLRTLGIGRSTFYKHVRKKLLHPILRIGTRDYFQRSTVEHLHRWHVDSKLPYRKLVPMAETTNTKLAA